jgi:hypothetical protein
MIRNDRQLARIVTCADTALQEIRDYLGQENKAAGKVRFPREFIRTAAHFRRKFGFLNDENLRRNIAYKRRMPMPNASSTALTPSSRK